MIDSVTQQEKYLHITILEMSSEVQHKMHVPAKKFAGLLLTEYYSFTLLGSIFFVFCFLLNPVKID